MTKFLNISVDNTLGGNSPSDVAVSSQKAVKEYVDAHSGGGGSTAVDNLSITRNSSLQIQTVGVIDSNNVTNAIKTWTGTKAQYDAILSKDANTLYNTDNGLFLGTTQVANLSSVRNIGEIIQSTIPLTDAGLHLLDGSLISGSGAYSAFVTYMANLYSTAAKVSNINIVGTLTDNNGVISGFSTGNYIKNNSPFSLGSNFEIVTKITTGGSFSNYEALFQSMPEYTGVKTYLASGKLAIALSSNGSSYDIGTYTATNALSTSTTYYIKVTYNGSVYNLDISTDGISYTNVTSFTSSLELAVSSYFRFGIDDNLIYPFNGSIDLNESYININGSRWWTGMQPQGFTEESQWQQSVTDYGVCGKFVYDSVNNTVRLPKFYSNERYLIASSSSGTEWYRIYSDGWCEQGGVNTVSGTSTVVSLLKNYINNNYSVMMQGYRDTYSSNNTTNIQLISKTTSQINIACATSTKSIGWQACGYIDISTYKQQTQYQYIVIATSTKTEIEVDIDEVMTDLNGKADVDLSNVNASGTSLASGWAMPSDRYIDLTLGASGSIYTAPANGYIYFSKDRRGSSNQYAVITGASDGIPGSLGDGAQADGYGVHILRPIKKGTTFKITYTLTGATHYFRFVYAEGEPNV